MNCSACGHENRTSAKFCGACAAPLLEKSTCSGCGSTNPPGRKFCDECGAALTARTAEAAGARKVVTIIFADLAASTALHERLDPESVTRFMESYYRAMRGAVEAHGGTVVKLLGDGVMAAFGVPRVAEDDAIRAVRAGVGMQHAFRTILFTDLEAHTAMMQRLGNARGRDVLRKHERLTREALRAHGWTEIHSSALPRSHFIMVA